MTTETILKELQSLSPEQIKIIENFSKIVSYQRVYNIGNIKIVAWGFEIFSQKDAELCLAYVKANSSKSENLTTLTVAPGENGFSIITNLKEQFKINSFGESILLNIAE